MQLINLFGGVVKGEGSSDCAWDLVSGHEWLRAVVPSSDGNSLEVEDGANIERVLTINDEG